MTEDEQKQDYNGDRHVVPMNDLREHEVTVKCWCHPFRDDEEEQVVIHRALDRRELIEQVGYH